MPITLTDIVPLIEAHVPDMSDPDVLGPEERAPLEASLRESYTELPEWLLEVLATYGARSLLTRPTYDSPSSNPWGDGTTRFEGFLGYTRRPGNINNVVEWLRGRLPDSLLPFSSDAGGNYLCYGLSGHLSGKVAFWDHEFRVAQDLEIDALAAELVERGADVSTLDLHQVVHAWHRLHPDALPGPPSYANVYVVADSFLEFLEALSATEEPPSMEELEEERAMFAALDARIR